MWLILSTKEANELNQQQAVKRGCKIVRYWWRSKTFDGNTALDVEDGDGLAEDYLSQCVKELPADFTKKDEA